MGIIVAPKGMDNVWKSVNSNNEGDSYNRIDKEEATAQTKSIYFVEENMTYKDFVERNREIYLAQSSGEETDKNEVEKLQKEKLSGAVSKVVKEMIKNGAFDDPQKREMIIGKWDYMDETTQELVFNMLTQEEKLQIWKHDQEQELEKIQEEEAKELGKKENKTFSPNGEYMMRLGPDLDSLKEMSP